MSQLQDIDAQQSTEAQKNVSELDLSEEVVPQADGATASAAPPMLNRHTIEFSGAAGEYFRIWIVNLFLTIVTLGIYGAWAKVRTRRYFYANTKLAGHSFDYLANPVAILRGNLVVAAGVLLYNWGTRFNAWLSFAIIVVFSLIMPVLIYKSLRFFSYNSSFRNIRFAFSGTLKDSYKYYLFMPLLVPCTLGLILPYWSFKRKQYFYDNFSFGNTDNTFSANAKSFYKIYTCAFGLMLLSFVIVGGCSAGVAWMINTGMISNPLVRGLAAAEPNPFNNPMIFWVMGVGYLVMFTVMSALQQYIYARVTNYCFSSAALGKIRFLSTLKVRRLLVIQLTNLIGIIFSLGMLIPWAKVRRTRYVLDNLVVMAEQNLDDFHAAVHREDSAIGDSATDYFDFEVAL